MSNGRRAPAPQAGSEQRAAAPRTESFAVRVVAFRGEPAKTLAVLQQSLGVERRAAQQLMAAAPVVVKRGCSAAQARAYQQALQGVGAEVVVERAESAGATPAVSAHTPARDGARSPEPTSTPAPPARAAASHAGSARREAAPPAAAAARARKRPVSAELEFDLSDAQPAAASRGDGAHKGAGAFGEEELGASAASSSAGRRAHGDGHAATALGDEVLFGAEALGLATGSAAATQAAYAAGAGPAPARAAARSAVLAKPAELPPLRVPLLRLLSAVGIVAVGVWVDNSILYGSANWIGLVAHAVAIYQLGLGLRGIFL